MICAEAAPDTADYEFANSVLVIGNAAPNTSF